MQLVIDSKLPTLNEYISANNRNRFISAKIKKEATELVSLLCRKLPKIDYPAWYTFTWYVKNQRTDPDNISHGVKYIFDGLVQAGKLPNDNLKYVVAIDHRFVVGKEQKVVIEIDKYDS